MPITSPELAWVELATSSPDLRLGAWGGSAGFSYRHLNSYHIYKTFKFKNLHNLELWQFFFAVVQSTYEG